MATHESEETLSGGKPDVATVANAFLHQYYIIFHNSPELLHKFYKDESTLKWQGVESVTTMEEINEKIMSSDYSGCEVKVMNADAQESLMESVILTVTGCLLGNDNVKRIISQTFFLAKQERGFFILNDNFQILDTHEILNHSFASQTSPADESEPADVPKSADVSKPVDLLKPADGPESADVSKPVDLPKPADAPAKPDAEKELSGTEATDPDITVPAAEIPKQPVILAQKLESQKTSYASVVAKESKVALPTDNSGHKIIRVAASSNQQSVASSSPNMTKERNASSGHGSTEMNSNLQNNSSSDFRSEASLSRSVYIQNLPSDITKTELADAVKKFGRVRPSDIQIRTFEDGFCFGFVEFESASSAKSAVEAHSITIKGYDSRISFKKSSAGRAGNNGGARMGGGGGGGFRGRSFKGQEKGENRSNGGGYHRDDNNMGGQMRGSDRQNRELGRGGSQSRDGGRAYGGEAYPRNNWRNDERWSNGGGGGGYRRNNSQMQSEGGITGAA